MNKLVWNPTTKSLAIQWNTKYHEVNQEMYWGRFGPGSGASPTLMGHKEGGEPELVVVTDGA